MAKAKWRLLTAILHIHPTKEWRVPPNLADRTSTEQVPDMYPASTHQVPCKYPTSCIQIIQHNEAYRGYRRTACNCLQEITWKFLLGHKKLLGLIRFF